MLSNLGELYAARADLAFTLETDTRQGKPHDHASHRHYEALCSDIRRDERTYAAAWHRPRATPALDWCSVCGSAFSERLPGHNACVMCEAYLKQPEKETPCDE